MMIGLFIHRRLHWQDFDNGIDHEEWLACCRADASLSEDGFEDYLQIQFVRHDPDAPPTLTPVFNWRTGKIEASRFHYFRGAGTGASKSPAVFVKALEIATLLDARVQDESGKFYTKEDVANMPLQVVRPWWRRMLGQ
jgi:hypothetical protein